VATIVGAIVAVLLGLVVIRGLYMMVYVVHEKEVVIIERLGKYNATLTAGIHFVIPYLDWPKRYTFHYFVTNDNGQRQEINKHNAFKISTQVKRERERERPPGMGSC
jgi:regulator of protease activity HflC (stomatin/prohibitin superfamily)